jgi:hypothetical protein
MEISKSPGQTRTEQYLARLCDRTFLNLWTYPNPYKADGKELCDLIGIFENNVFLFFDRESLKFEKSDADFSLTWERWKREAITKQIQTASGAKRYIQNNRNEIYLDAGKQTRLPIQIPVGDLKIFKIVVAHGAKEACEQFSEQNIYGSLGISYEREPPRASLPFIVPLDRDDPVHVLDSHNLELILGELDTVSDFQRYLEAKEKAISRYDHFTYCGEEDLLAHYFQNFDPATKTYLVGTKEDGVNGLMIGEGEWRDFVKSSPYKRRRTENQISYTWDDLLQKTGQNALNGILLGNAEVFRGKSPIHEMAKEPRLSRRALSERMAKSIANFPDNATGNLRYVSFLPSFFPDRGYVFLQLYKKDRGDYDTEYRPFRSQMLQFACGAAKLKYPNLEKVIGIAIDAPKYHRMNSEDFILLDCEKWSEDDQAYYEEANRTLRFFTTDKLKQHRGHVTEFPSAQRARNVPKIGRNQLCPCGSGKKYKRCHGFS